MKNCLLAFSMMFFALHLSAQDSYNALVYRGNQAFKKGNYGAATSGFMDALKINPKDFTAHYNLGNTLYKQKKYAEAQAEYQKAGNLAKNKADKAAALYNLGNTYMQDNNHKKAADAYKQALKQDPYNEATQKNYQIAKLKEKEQNQKNQQQKQDGGKGDKQDDKNKKGGNDGDKGRQPQSGQGPKGENGQGSNGNNPQQQKNSASGMPKNVEDALLNRAGNKERETAKRILNKDSYSTPQSNEKDW